MAKLHERPIIEEIDEASDPTRFDNDLKNLLIAHSNNPEELLRTVVGFVDRTTRFFKQPDASRKLAKLVEGASPATSSGKGFLGKASERDTNAASKVQALRSSHAEAPEACKPLMLPFCFLSVLQPKVTALLACHRKMLEQQQMLQQQLQQRI